MTLTGELTPEEEEIMELISERDRENRKKINMLSTVEAKHIIRKKWHSAKNKQELYDTLKQIGMSRDEITSYLGYSNFKAVYRAIRA